MKTWSEFEVMRQLMEAPPGALGDDSALRDRLRRERSGIPIDDDLIVKGRCARNDDEDDGEMERLPDPTPGSRTIDDVGATRSLRRDASCDSS